MSTTREEPHYSVRPSIYDSEDWIVEDTDGEGTFVLFFFSGPDAEARAREYADWKNSQEPRAL